MPISGPSADATTRSSAKLRVHDGACIGYPSPQALQSACGGHRNAADCGLAQSARHVRVCPTLCRQSGRFLRLPDLTDADLKDLGVVVGDRRKILRAIARLDATPEKAVTEPASPLSAAAAVQASPIVEGASEQRDATPCGIAQTTQAGKPRANYHGLIAGAVKGLDRSSAEARQMVYERARTALVAHLRFNQPGLLKADIVKERLALEEAIREIEAEARKPRTEVPATHPASTSSVDGSAETSQQGGGSPAPADMLKACLPAARPDEQSLSRLSSLEAVRGHRDVVSEVQGFAAIIGTAAQTGPHPPEVHDEAAVDPRPVSLVHFDRMQERGHERYQWENDKLIVAPPLRPLSRSALSRSAESGDERSSLAQGGLARLLVAVTVVIGVAATVFWQWSAITEFYQFLNHTGLQPQRQIGHKTPTKIPGGVAQQQSSADARGGGAKRPDRIDSRAAGPALRRGADRSAREALHRLRHLAHGNSSDKARACS
jgi:hypothetical protein